MEKGRSGNSINQHIGDVQINKKSTGKNINFILHSGLTNKHDGLGEIYFSSK